VRFVMAQRKGHLRGHAAPDLDGCCSMSAGSFLSKRAKASTN
jgi:hypothetical protein